MSHLNIIQNPRNGCALHGALTTVQAIPGVVPVVHSNPGCSVISHLSGKNNGAGVGNYLGASVPSTTSQERHIIFGGASRLREQIKNTVKVVPGDLYVILNSCESAMVGDDVDAMTREIVEQGEPVLDSLIAGFNGGFHYGYEHLLADIFTRLETITKLDSAKDEKLVNILGVVPGREVYFNGNLEEIKRILNRAGLKVNTFFGPDAGVSEFKSAGNAAASIVFSKWGELPAEVLNEKYQVPVVLLDKLPVGADQVHELLKVLSDTVAIDQELLEEIYQSEKRFEDYYLSNALEDIAEDSSIASVSIVADEEAAIRYGSFFKDKLGISVDAIVVTDSLQKDDEHKTNNQALLNSIAGNVVVTQDKKLIEQTIKKAGSDIVLGSSLERGLAEKLETPILEISFPIDEKKILSRGHVGVRGEIEFIEDYISVLKQYKKARKEKILKGIKEDN